jgi:hypothetical protein
MQAVEKRFETNGKPPHTILWLNVNVSGYTAAVTRYFARQIVLIPVTIPATRPHCNGVAESFLNTLTSDYSQLANSLD